MEVACSAKAVSKTKRWDVHVFAAPVAKRKMFHLRMTMELSRPSIITLDLSILSDHQVTAIGRSTTSNGMEAN